MTFNSRFVWADLSTYDTEEAKQFYKGVFGWSFYNGGGGSSEDYFIARKKGSYFAGLYVLPEEFQRNNFPHFWMPYIHVEDISKTVEIAQGFEGTRIEVPPMTFKDGSQIALIRDPLGAGFTIYQGEDHRGSYKHFDGLPASSELHVSDLSLVKPFYESLFNWQLRPTDKKGELSI